MKQRTRTRIRRSILYSILLLSVIFLSSLLVDRSHEASLLNPKGQSALVSDDFPAAANHELLNALERASTAADDCEIPELRLCNNPCSEVTYSGSYPGSGAELFRAVVEAISGYQSTEVYKKRNSENDERYFLVKTHGPLMEAFVQSAPLVEPKQAIYLIRNPLWSIPSFFNWQYERRNQLKDHSAQAPHEKWLEWRSHNWAREFRSWRHHVDHWATQWDATHLFVLPYEGLTEYGTGPLWTYRVAQFLETRAGLAMEAPDRIGCLWKAVVKGGKSKKRGKKTYTPDFTVDQLKVMEVAMEELRQKHGSKFPVLDKILQGYIQETRLRRLETPQGLGDSASSAENSTS